MFPLSTSFHTTHFWYQVLSLVVMVTPGDHLRPDTNTPDDFPSATRRTDVIKHVILWATILNNLGFMDMKLWSLTWYFLLVSPQESTGSILQKLMWAIQPEPEESEAPTSNHFTFLLLWFFIRPSSCLCLFRCFPLFCSGSFVSTPDVLFVVVFLVVMSQILNLSQVTVLTLISCQN